MTHRIHRPPAGGEPAARRRPVRSLALLVALGAVAACGGEPATESAVASAPVSTVADPSATTDVTAPSSADPATGKPEVQLPTTPPTELVVTDLIEGTGDPIELGDTITLDYVGVISADGTEFDSSYEREPITFTLTESGLIAGFVEGLIGARAGGRRQLDIPASLAYGDTGAGGVIAPGDAISFVVDVRSVTKPVPVTAPPMADPADCPATDGSAPQQREFAEYPPFCIDVTKSYTAEVATNFGDFTIRLDPRRAPLTVNSFVVLAWHHYFDGTECHRAIPGFVVQCGDPTATGTGGPGYRFADELPLAGEYRIGSLAMANSGPDTNGSQFFIVTGPNGAGLPPQYTLFGEVTAGLDSTVAALDAVANPSDNGVPPLEQILIESVTITVS